MRTSEWVCDHLVSNRRPFNDFLFFIPFWLATYSELAQSWQKDQQTAEKWVISPLFSSGFISKLCVSFQSLLFPWNNKHCNCRPALDLQFWSQILSSGSRTTARRHHPIPVVSSGSKRYFDRSPALFFRDPRTTWFIPGPVRARRLRSGGTRIWLPEWLPICTQSNCRTGRKSDGASQTTQGPDLCWSGTSLPGKRKKVSHVWSWVASGERFFRIRHHVGSLCFRTPGIQGQAENQPIRLAQNT